MQLLASYTCINYQQQGRIQDFQRKGAPFDPPNGNYDMLLVSTEQTQVLDLSSVSVADRGGGGGTRDFHAVCGKGGVAPSSRKSMYQLIFFSFSCNFQQKLWQVIG